MNMKNSKTQAISSISSIFYKTLVLFIICGKCDSIEVLIDSYIGDDEFLSVNYVLKEYDEIKEKIRNPNNKLICLM